MKYQTSLLRISVILVISFSIIAFVSCKKNANPPGFTTKPNNISIAEAKKLYDHIKGNLSGVLASYGYKNISPEYDKVKTVSGKPESSAIFVPLFFNKHSGRYIQMVIVKQSGRKSGVVMIFSPDKEWYKDSTIIHDYSKLNGIISFWDISGMFLKEVNVEKGLVSTRVLLDSNMHATDDWIMIPNQNVNSFRNDQIDEKGQIESLSIASRGSLCGSCHNDPDVIELAPVVVVSAISTPPSFYVPEPLYPATNPFGPGGYYYVMPSQNDNNTEEWPSAMPDLCSYYNFKVVGNSYTTTIKYLQQTWVQREPPFERVWTNVTESCLSIPNYGISQAQASEIFNEAFNYGTNQIIRELNAKALLPTSYAISARMKKLVQDRLVSSRPGSLWNTGKSCDGDVPSKEADWCP